MVLLHVPRVLWTVARGLRWPSSPQVGTSVAQPHVYRARVNPIFDMDQFGHMNNSAYNVHLELARCAGSSATRYTNTTLRSIRWHRWEMAVATGWAKQVAKTGAAFIVASSAVRFRKELRPLQPYRIHSSITGADERSMWMLQTFHADGTGMPLAGGLCRAVLRKGRETISPLSFLDGIGVDAATLTSLAASAPRADHEALSVLEKALVADGASPPTE